MSKVESKPEQQKQDFSTSPENWSILKARFEELEARHKNMMLENKIDGNSSYFDKTRNMIGICLNIFPLPYTNERADIVKRQLDALEEYFEFIGSDIGILNQEIEIPGQLQLQAKKEAGNQPALYTKSLKKLLGK